MNLSIRVGVRALKTVTINLGAAALLLSATFSTPLLASSPVAADDTQPICTPNIPSQSAFPTAPTLLSPSNDGTDANGFNFMWSNVDGATSYEWESSNIAETNDNGYFVRPLASHNLVENYINEGNSHSGLYYWHVRAINADGQAGYWSATWMVTIDSNSLNNLSAPTLTGPVSNATCNIYSDDFDFTWVAPDSSNGSNLSYIFQSGYTNETDPLTGEFINHPWTDYNLHDTQVSDGNSASGTYYWHVRAVADDGTLGPWSESWVVKIVRTAPEDTTPTTPTDPTPTTGDSTGNTTIPDTTTTVPATAPAVMTATKLVQLQSTTTDTRATASKVLDASTSQPAKSPRISLSSATVTVKANWMARNGIWLIATLLALFGSSTIIYQNLQKFRTH